MAKPSITDTVDEKTRRSLSINFIAARPDIADRRMRSSDESYISMFGVPHVFHLGVAYLSGFDCHRTDSDRKPAKSNVTALMLGDPDIDRPLGDFTKEDIERWYEKIREGRARIASWTIQDMLNRRF